MLECVANVSEGHDTAVLRALARACGDALVDVHADADHHRSVFTLAGPGPDDAAGAARDLAAAVVGRVSIAGHAGVHPRLGALDVVPFVALDDADGARDRAARTARDFGAWWADAYGVPVFCYDDADPDGRDLPSVRRAAFTTLAPDFGPDRPHPTLGATAAGARRPLVAVNALLGTPDTAVARRIAHRIRERDGGLPGVRALGFGLESRGRAQVSMNLVDLERCGVEDACRVVRELARRESTDVAAIEVVGLVPRRELERCSREFLEWSGLDTAATVEARIGHGPRSLP